MTHPPLSVAICLVLLCGMASGLHAQASPTNDSIKDALDVAQKMYDLQRESQKNLEAASFLKLYSQIRNQPDRAAKIAELTEGFPNALLDQGVRDILAADEKELERVHRPLTQQEEQLEAARRKAMLAMAEQKWQAGAQDAQLLNLAGKTLDIIAQKKRQAAAQERQHVAEEQRQAQQTGIQQQQTVDRQQEILFLLGKVHRPGTAVVLPSAKQQAALWKEYLRLQMSRGDLPEQARQQANDQLASIEQEERNEEIRELRARAQQAEVDADMARLDAKKNRP